MAASIRFALAITWMMLIPFAAKATELIMVEQDGCHWCAQWNKEIAPIYPKTAEGKIAPLRRVNIRDLPRDISFQSAPVFTPTFVLVDEGQELGRLEGYSGDQFFWFLLSKLLENNPDATGVSN